MGLLDGLSSSERELLLYRKEQRVVPAGTELYRVGDPAEHVYYIVSGRVATSGLVEGEGEREFRSFGPGQLFGIAALFPNGPARLATAKATEETVVLEVNSDAVSLLKSHGGPAPTCRFLLNLVKVACSQLQELREVLGQKRITLQRHPDYQVDPGKWMDALTRAIPTGFLTRLFQKTRHSPGEIVFREAETTDRFFFLKSGSIRATSSGGGEEIVHAPQVFGHVCLFAGCGQSFTVTVEEEAEILPFTQKALEDYIKSNPEEGLELLNALLMLTAYQLVAVQYKR